MRSLPLHLDKAKRGMISSFEKRKIRFSKEKFIQPQIPLMNSN